jgi:UDP-N-acetylmuramoyl-L-alanyl-D-glutamate--2,6-diaminopimelate ligase
MAIAPALPVRNLWMDSRQVGAGDAFVALSGGRTHGFAHVAAAVSQGAVAVLCEAAEVATAPALPPQVALVPVSGLRENLGELAARVVQTHGDAIDVVGITGTNGKTTVAWLLAAALEQCHRPAAYAGTLGAGRPGAIVAGTHTTPDVFSVHAQLAAFVAAGAGTAAIEVSSHALDQGRVAGVRFKVAAFTHLTRDHLDYHHTFAAYGAAKARLFRWPGLEHAVLNVGDAFVRTLVANLDPAVTLTTVDATPSGVIPHAPCWVQVNKITPQTSGLTVAFATHAGAVEITAALIGRFNAENLAMVLGVLLALGVPLQVAANSLQACRPPPGRMEVVPATEGAGPLVLVDYAHTPDALNKALSAAREHCRGALWVVFGCGGDRDAGKRPQMGAIACAMADHVIITDDNPRSESGAAIAAMVLAGCASPSRVEIIQDRTLAITSAVQRAVAGDLVLVAGKGHETTQTVGAQVIPFSDVAVASAARRRAA